MPIETPSITITNDEPVTIDSITSKLLSTEVPKVRQVIEQLVAEGRLTVDPIESYGQRSARLNAIYDERHWVIRLGDDKAGCWHHQLPFTNPEEGKRLVKNIRSVITRLVDQGRRDRRAELEKAIKQRLDQIFSGERASAPFSASHPRILSHIRTEIFEAIAEALA